MLHSSEGFNLKKWMHEAVYFLFALLFLNLNKHQERQFGVIENRK